MDLKTYALTKFKHATADQQLNTRALMAAVSVVYGDLELQDTDLRKTLVQTWCNLGVQRAKDLQELDYLEFVNGYPSFNAAVQLHLLSTPQRSMFHSEVCEFRCYHCEHANSVSTTEARNWESGHKITCKARGCGKEVIVTSLQHTMMRPTSRRNL